MYTCILLCVNVYYSQKKKLSLFSIFLVYQYFPYLPSHISRFLVKANAHTLQDVQTSVSLWSVVEEFREGVTVRYFGAKEILVAMVTELLVAIATEEHCSNGKQRLHNISTATDIG